MFREELSADAGMLFQLDELGFASVTMENMLIPLSVAYFDGSGTIVWIEDLEPCSTDPCPLAGAPSEVTGFLEVNAGAFERWGVGRGDRLTVVGD